MNKKEKRSKKKTSATNQKKIKTYTKTLSKLNKEREKESSAIIGLIVSYNDDNITRELNEIENSLPVEKGARRLYWMRHLRSILYPVISEDQKAYWYSLEIVCAGLIYGEEIETNLGR